MSTPHPVEEEVEIVPLQTGPYEFSRMLDVSKGGLLTDSSDFCSNRVRTARYTLWSFLPLNLFEQFQEMANVYFLVIGVFQSIPEVSTTQGVPTIYLPLIFILAVSATRAAVEDYSRHLTDKKESSRPYSVWGEQNQWIQRSSGDLKVGDIVKVPSDATVPADMLILRTSHPRGYCFVETASLDGETSLKLKRAFSNTQTSFDGEDCSTVSLRIQYEAPNKSFDQFKAVMSVKGEPFEGLLAEQLLLRDTSLKNTKMTVGLVLYTGEDTKIRKNNTTDRPRVPKSSVSKKIDQFLILMFILQFCLCFFAATFQGSWTTLYSQRHWYVAIEDISSVPEDSILRMFTWYIILAQFVPISLIVSLELVKTMQAFFITQDLSIYDETTDKPAQVQSLMLNEELGQIEYIFTDKTGTLTQNKMQFRAAFIGRQLFGSCETDISRRVTCINSQRERQLWTVLVKNLSKVSPGTENDHVNFDASEQVLREIEKDPEGLAHRFMVNMAVSNTITPVEGSFQSSSPDELALCHFASSLGYNLTCRNPTVLTVGEKEIQLHHLATLDFNSKRKRLTMVYRDQSTSDIWVMCKGADASLFPLVEPSEWNKGLQVTLEDELVRLSDFGLRTLVIAEAKQTQLWWDKWNGQWSLALSLPEVDRELDHTKGGCQPDCRICECARLIEIDAGLKLIGATAIEDQLQELVPEAIDDFLRSGMKVWMLTGDKKETAKNIALACNLIHPESSDRLIEISGKWAMLVGDSDHLEVLFNAWDLDHDGILEKEEIIAFLSLLDAPIDVTDMFQSESHQGWDIEQFVSFMRTLSLTFQDAVKAEIIGGFALMDGPTATSMIIEGNALDTLYTSNSPNVTQLRDKFFQLASRSRSVICCRCTPHQKALMVREIQKRQKAVCLAIGDGANDEQMIVAADVGVGISGLEGTAAARASDYSIGRFRFLHTLLFVHGVWSYQRIALLAQIIFYKTSFVTFGMFCFGAVNVFSGQQFFHDSVMLFYNILFTSAPVIVVAVLDKAIPRHIAEIRPVAYKSLRGGALCNWKTWLSWMASSAFHSVIVFGVIALSIGEHSIGREDGRSNGIWSLSQVNYAVIVFIANFVSVFYMHSITYIHITSVFLSLGVYFIVVSIGSILPQLNPQVFGVFQNVFSQPSSWFAVLLAVSIPLLHFLCLESYKAFFNPTVLAVLREQEDVKVLQRVSRGIKRMAVKIKGWTGHRESKEKRASFVFAKSTRDPMLSIDREKNRFFQRGGYAYDANPKGHAVLDYDK